MSNLVRAVWKALPMKQATKDALEPYLLRLLSPLLRRTPFHRRWSEYLDARARLPSGLPASDVRPEVVPPEETLEPFSPRIRLVAFYLPQFHPIPENDTWWGEGFTEWTNVVRGTPQFEGHDQPKVPGELGYYDLRTPEVMRRQVELARTYGVGGFCFYCYWFGGTRLLEVPLLNYLGDRSLDLPFCLCWANESWTRRWVGRSHEILMAQDHSATDDLRFIEYAARYLEDPRNIRIEGRPLLVVYRPDLLPCAIDTAERWRDWCRKTGIGEIYLAYVQTSSHVDPGRFGFDAAIEFPPNHTRTPEITWRVRLLNPDFSGSVRDWRIFLERSRAYDAPAYRLFRGVNPSWDNEARSPGRGTVYYGATPEGYREWLLNAARDTIARFEQPDERLVFVNAWNEWGEGACLEPDQRHGYAYLQATRDALIQLEGEAEQ